MKVAGLGQCSLDFIASLPRFPKEDTKMEALGLTVQGGGPVATALVSLSRLGARTYFMGVVSKDSAGGEIIEGLKDEGVDVSRLKVRRAGDSQRAFILVNGKTGSRTILWKRPSAPMLKPAELRTEFIKGKDMLLLDGLMIRASLKAARIAKRLQIPVMLDAGRMREGMMELASLSDYIVASEEFSKDISNRPEDTLRKLALLHPKAVTVTLGERGSLTWHDGEVFRTPAFKVKAVDSTGAGDVFHGGYIYALLRGWDLRKTLLFSSAFAALKCRTPGGRAGIPGLNETLRFMYSRKS